METTMQAQIDAVIEAARVYRENIVGNENEPDNQERRILQALEDAQKTIAWAQINVLAASM